jgi:hypothetical protein
MRDLHRPFMAGVLVGLGAIILTCLISLFTGYKAPTTPIQEGVVQDGTKIETPIDSNFIKIMEMQRRKVLRPGETIPSHEKLDTQESK